MPRTILSLYEILFLLLAKRVRDTGPGEEVPARSASAVPGEMMRSSGRYSHWQTWCNGQYVKRGNQNKKLKKISNKIREEAWPNSLKKIYENKKREEKSPASKVTKRREKMNDEKKPCGNVAATVAAALSPNPTRTAKLDGCIAYEITAVARLFLLFSDCFAVAHPEPNNARLLLLLRPVESTARMHIPIPRRITGRINRSLHVPSAHSASHSRYFASAAQTCPSSTVVRALS